MENIKLLGYVGVDSGQLMITDPCYLDEFRNNAEDLGWSPENPRIKIDKNDRSYSYTGVCGTNHNDDQGGEIGDGKGVCFSSGLGDGAYPIYAQYENDEYFGKRITKIVIDLD